MKYIFGSIDFYISRARIFENFDPGFLKFDPCKRKNINRHFGFRVSNSTKHFFELSNGRNFEIRNRDFVISRVLSKAIFGLQQSQIFRYSKGRNFENRSRDFVIFRCTLKSLFSGFNKAKFLDTRKVHIFEHRAWPRKKKIGIFEHRTWPRKKTSSDFRTQSLAKANKNSEFRTQSLAKAKSNTFFSTYPGQGKEKNSDFRTRNLAKAKKIQIFRT